MWQDNIELDLSEIRFKAGKLMQLIHGPPNDGAWILDRTSLLQPGLFLLASQGHHPFNFFPHWNAIQFRSDRRGNGLDRPKEISPTTA